MEIRYRPKFARQYKKLPQDVRQLAQTALDNFKKDPFQKRLRTHKLGGPLHDYWAFSVNFEYRIIFRLADKHAVELYQIGKHDIYE